MITTIVQFRFSQPLAQRQIPYLFSEVVAHLEQAEGLLCRSFTKPTAAAVGGTLLWRSRSAAENFFADLDLSALEQYYGATLAVSYLEMLILLDK